MSTESTIAETELVQDTPKELQVIVQQNSLQPATAQSLQASFAPIFSQARSVIEKSRGIVVTDANQKLEMKMARACRLELKAIRVTGDKLRKELKDESLRVGRAIDGFNAILLHIVETEEKRLQAQEDFVEQQEAQRKATLKADREKVLATIQVDPNLYQLGDMSEETFQQLVEGTKLARAAEAERRRKEEADRIAKEKADAEERERIRLENERLKKEAADKAAAEKLERERRHDLHCTRMAILGAEKLLTNGEIADADFVESYGTQSEEEFALIRERFRVRQVEEKRLADERAETARKLKEAEEKAAAEKARVDAERKAAEEKAAKERAEVEAKAKSERDTLEAKAKKEREEHARKIRELEAAAKKKADEDRAAREELDRKITAQKAADEKRQADEAEAARKAAAAPDKDKLMNYAHAVRALEIPELKTAPALATLIQQQRDKFVAWLESSVDKI